MNPLPPTPATADSNVEFPSEHSASAKQLREELIKTQLMVVELSDRLAVKETEKADFTSILAQLELALETKATEYVELDLKLRAQLRELETTLGSSRAHAAACETEKQTLIVSLESARREIAQLQTSLATTTKELAATHEALETSRTALAATQNDLNNHQQVLARERHRLEKIFRSTLWRWGRPWRALFGPKV